MARWIARAVFGLLAVAPVAGAALAPTAAHAQASDARKFDAQAAADKAVAHAIAWGGKSASLIADNVTRLVLNNPGYVAQIVAAIVKAAADPDVPAGIAEALGIGLGAAYALASGASGMQAAIKSALTAAKTALPAGRSLAGGFSTAFQAGVTAATTGSLPKVANVPAAATLDAVLAAFIGGLPVNETGTISRN